MGVEVELRSELYEMGDDVVSDSDLDYHVRIVLTNVLSVSVLRKRTKAQNYSFVCPAFSFQGFADFLHDDRW